GSRKSAGSRMRKIQPATSSESSSRTRTPGNRQENKYGCKHDPSSPSPPGNTGKNLSRLSRSGRNGQMASAKWVYLQGSPHERQDWRHLQDVVYEFHDRQEPFVRRNVCGTYAARTHSLHGQI